MEFYVFIIAVLFIAAISDLIVGVSNDAVNFLTSAIGSKAGSRKTIMITASLGVLAGTTFSSGIMEVARKGIFNPEFYVFHEVMIIFLAVMITDVILLDLYNTFSLPTSTSVSIVFEILGGAVAIALLKIGSDPNNSAGLVDYINTANMVRIISSIGLSILFAFIFGYLIMFVTRLIFSFDYEKSFSRYGPIFAGVAMSSIIYVILVKGLKGSSFMTPDLADTIKTNLNNILIYIFFGSTFLWYIIASFTKINILRIIVLIGTFALALAFAANDLVNFIGAPMGALESFRLARLGSFDMAMEGLNNPVQANTLILLVAGLIMVITLWLSRKARGVTRTTVDLSRQDSGFERFESNLLARSLVKFGLRIGQTVANLTPPNLVRAVRKQMDVKQAPTYENLKEKPSFDLLRASVNLFVASALVSIGTSLKLPLSTTFVTFSVAMATSLADRAWGRESAVYRVAGVLTVIGGWIGTAILAFTACFVCTWLIYFVETPAIIILIIGAGYYYVQSNRHHSKREDELYAEMESRADLERSLSPKELLKNDTLNFINSAQEVVVSAIEGLASNKIKRLKKARKQLKTVRKHSFRIMNHLMTNEDESLIRDHAQHMGYLNMSMDNLEKIISDAHEYLNNNHHPFSREEIEDFQSLSQHVSEVTGIITDQDAIYDENDIDIPYQTMEEAVIKMRKKELKRVKSKSIGVKTGMIFLGTVTKTKFFLDHLKQFSIWQEFKRLEY